LNQIGRENPAQIAKEKGKENLWDAHGGNSGTRKKARGHKSTLPAKKLQGTCGNRKGNKKVHVGLWGRDLEVPSVATYLGGTRRKPNGFNPRW